MKKALLGLLAVLFLVFIIGCSSEEESNATADQEEAKDSDEKGQTITFGVTPWTSTVPPTKIASLILQDMGYEVEEIEAEAGSVYAGLARGDIDVFMDSWLPGQSNYLEKFSDKIEKVALSYDDADSGLVVPKYMEDINDIGDIKGKEDMFNNEIYSVGEGDPATKNIDKVIEGYDLDMVQINSSEGAMMAQAVRMMKKEEPVMFYGWRPHTMFNKYNVKIISNEKTPEYFNASTVNVIANKELKENDSDVYNFLSNWSISLKDVEEMITMIDSGDEPEEVAREWIDNNQEKVEEMIEK
ncbi:Glycine betaine/carnitine transport binding protein GbuC precursor [Paraliobacillus sp. PM-2]|uniref:glycine betaine ABC transporter substrate-binding protein n=1 Tax=Paraliobacillus sp. PM-2 TaxID=1462524 RepID=UPI00061C6158|nr:glycine betaine ABC transporter substrate-binding protein [Paraliobacillus sp. PM-2]CQR45890.1 Glycine betaine/carnitine transport binding protein GbuC precursor [Paraliobacillus sp. PM-2]